MTKNIAKELNDSELKSLARQATESYEEDIDSVREHRAKHADWLSLYYQTYQPESKPWSGSSESSVPLMAEAVNQFQSRAYKAFFPSRQFISGVSEDATNRKHIKAAEKVGKHMSHQLTRQDKTYRKNKNAMFQACALYGDDFTKVYYDPVYKKNRILRVRSEDFVVPYKVGPCHIDDLERMTHIIYESVNNTKILAANGFLIEPAIAAEYTEESPIQDVEDDAQGVSRDIYSSGGRGAIMHEHHCMLDIEGGKYSKPYIVTLDATSKKILRVQKNYTKKDDLFERIRYFFHYKFLENPDGFYGRGLGHLIGQLNMSSNAMIRQIEDAGTLANVGNMSGYVSDKMGSKGGTNEIQLGTFQKINRSVDDIRKSVYQFQFPGANPSLVNTLEYIVQTAQRLSSTTDAVTGDINKVVQPLTIMTLLESALQLPTSVMEQMSLTFEEEVTRLFELNREYFDETEKFFDGKGTELISAEDYALDMHVVPLLDPRNITRQQKIAKAQETYNFVVSNPVLSQNPEAIISASKGVLRAIDTEDMDDIIPDSEEPQRIDDQAEENMILMLPKDKQVPISVFSDQDHAEHIAKIDELLALLNQELLPTNMPSEPPEQGQIVDETVLTVIMGMTDDVKQEIIIDLLAHRREHAAYLYGVSEKGVLGGQGINSRMDGAFGNEMGVQEIGGRVQPGGVSPTRGGGQLEVIQGSGGGTGLSAGDSGRGTLGLSELDNEGVGA